jgi:hypothetical protein
VGLKKGQRLCSLDSEKGIAGNEQLKKNCSRKEYEQILLESIDNALDALGKSAKASIYFHLEQEFAIAKQEIPYRIEDFSDGIERIFGLGARHLEILIMKNLHAKIAYNCKYDGKSSFVSDLTFRKYVELLRLCYEDTGKIGDIEVLMNAEEQQEQHI